MKNKKLMKGFSLLMGIALLAGCSGADRKTALNGQPVVGSVRFFAGGSVGNR